MFLDSTEVFLHHEFELVEEALVVIDETYGHATVEAIEQVIEKVVA